MNPNSLADRCSIKPGDYILRIGNLSTEHLTHNQARDSVIRQGNNLELTLQRYFNQWNLDLFNFKILIKKGKGGPL